MTNIIDHNPIRLAVYNQIKQHPARLPATIDSIKATFLPKEHRKIAHAIPTLLRTGWVEEVAPHKFLATGLTPLNKTTTFYNAITTKWSVGDQVSRSELSKVASDLGFNSNEMESARGQLVEFDLLAPVSRGVCQIQAPIETKTLDDLGPVNPIKREVWGLLDSLPTEFNTLADTLSTEGISKEQFEKALDELGDSVLIMIDEDYPNNPIMTRARRYIPSSDEVLYHSFLEGECFSPKQAIKDCSLSSNDLYACIGKLIRLGAIEKVERGLYRKLPLPVRQQVAVTTSPTQVNIFEDEVAVVQVAEVADTTPSPLELNDFDVLARQVRNALAEKLTFEQEYTLKIEEVALLREQARSFIENADRIEATYIKKQEAIEAKLDQAKDNLARSLT